MLDQVIIVIPSQGEDIGAFEDSARALSSEVYAKRATLLRTTVRDITPPGVGDDKAAKAYDVRFSGLDGKTFWWGRATGVSRVITISHAFSCDGPNMAYHGGGYQPWGAKDDDCTGLSDGGRSFWSMVGRSMASDGRIILLGCFMGAFNYAQLVAAAADRPVYASKSLFAAGNRKTAVDYVKAIEHGRVPAPMEKFGPVIGRR